jgi:hypothetical protein
MEIREGPVHQVQIEVIQAQIAQGLFKGRGYVPRRVLVVPELGGDPEISSRDGGITRAAADRVLQHGTDLGLVAVDRGAVDVAVSDADRVAHRFGHLPGTDRIGTEGAEPDGRDDSARVSFEIPYPQNEAGIVRHRTSSGMMLDRRDGAAYTQNA